MRDEKLDQPVSFVYLYISNGTSNDMALIKRTFSLAPTVYPFYWQFEINLFYKLIHDWFTYSYFIHSTSITAFQTQVLQLISSPILAIKIQS